MSRSGLCGVLSPNLEEILEYTTLGAVTGGGEKVTFCYLANITLQDVYKWVIWGADSKSGRIY